MRPSSTISPVHFSASDRQTLQGSVEEDLDMLNRRQLEDTLKDTLLGYSRSTRLLRNAIFDMKETMSRTALDVSKDFMASTRFPLRVIRKQMFRVRLTLEEMSRVTEVVNSQLESLNNRCRELIVSAGLLVCDTIQEMNKEDSELKEDVLSSQILNEKRVRQSIE